MKMSDIGKKVVYTPEIVTVEKGKPVEAILVAIGQHHLRVTLADGTEETVPLNACKLL